MPKHDPWPKMAESPPAWTLHPDGFLRSDRPLAGPLRMGTAPGVGPSGRSNTGLGSDFGTDKVSPRRFDPIGSHNTRSPEREPSSRVSTEIRRKPFEKSSDAD